MLKVKILIISLLFTSIAQYWAPDVILPKVVEKRFQKNIQKLFKGEDYIKTPLVNSDSLLQSSRNYFYKLESQNNSKKYLVCLTIANGCKLGGCDINKASGEEFEVFYIYSLYSEIGALLDVKILDYQSDYGYQITSKWWLKQFVKQQESLYIYGKNIDAISGATTSVKSTIKEMNRNKKIVSDLLNQ